MFSVICSGCFLKINVRGKYSPGQKVYALKPNLSSEGDSSWAWIVHRISAQCGECRLKYCSVIFNPKCAIVWMMLNSVLSISCWSSVGLHKLCHNRIILLHLLDIFTVCFLFLEGRQGRKGLYSLLLWRKYNKGVKNRIYRLDSGTPGRPPQAGRHEQGLWPVSKSRWGMETGSRRANECASTGSSHHPVTSPVATVTAPASWPLLCAPCWSRSKSRSYHYGMGDVAMGALALEWGTWHIAGVLAITTWPGSELELLLVSTLLPHTPGQSWICHCCFLRPWTGSSPQRALWSAFGPGHKVNLTPLA